VDHQGAEAVSLYRVDVLPTHVPGGDWSCLVVMRTGSSDVGGVTYRDGKLLTSRAHGFTDTPLSTESCAAPTIHTRRGTGEGRWFVSWIGSQSAVGVVECGFGVHSHKSRSHRYTCSDRLMRRTPR
jgi:hypothetical protein